MNMVLPSKDFGAIFCRALNNVLVRQLNWFPFIHAIPCGVSNFRHRCWIDVTTFMLQSVSSQDPIVSRFAIYDKEVHVSVDT